MSEKQKGSGLIMWLRKGPILALGAALGIALILLGNGAMTANKTDTDETATKSDDPLYEYADRIERKITLLCEQVEGVSEVSVAISLEGDVSYVYATDSDTREREGEVQSNLSYVTVGSGSSEQTVLLTRQLPRVSGVGIVCRGGGDAAVRQEITWLLEAAYGISSHHIYITEANP